MIKQLIQQLCLKQLMKLKEPDIALLEISTASPPNSASSIRSKKKEGESKCQMKKLEKLLTM